MNLLSLITDNITELLVKIIEFTETRQKILTRNVRNIDSPDYVPKDLAVEEFCRLMRHAINEHIENQRLVLRDTESIKFGIDGGFAVEPVVDAAATKLLRENRDRYLELQMNKILENSLNQRVAVELLRQRQTVTS